MKKTPKHYRSLSSKGIDVTSDRDTNLKKIEQAPLSQDGYNAISTATAAAEGHRIREDHFPIHTAASEALFGAAEIQNPDGGMNVGATAIKAEQLDDYLESSALANAAIMSDEDYANLPLAPEPRAADGTLHADMEKLSAHFTDIEKRHPHTPVTRAILNHNSIYEAENPDNKAPMSKRAAAQTPRRS